jgi:NAD+ synthetase
MRIALAQIDNIIGDLQYNKRKIIEYYEKAVDEKVDLVLFPELALTGYTPRDLIEKKEFRKKTAQIANEIASVTNAETAIVFGSITEKDETVGTGVYNSAILAYDGKIRFVQDKTLLPNYDVFDERRYFESAKSVSVFEYKGEKLGISICEDIWNDGDYWKRRRYESDPVEDLIELGATLLINISASPYAYGRRKERYDMLSLLTKTNSLPLAYVCTVGAQTDLIFDGASMCFNEKGELVHLGKTYAEDFIVFDTDKNYAPILEFEKSFEEEAFNAIVFGLREYMWKTGFKEVVLGLSGGIDSAVVAAIATEAVGKENVHAIMLPSKISSKGSVEDAKKLIDNLGIKSGLLSIAESVAAIEKTLEPFFAGTRPGVAEENVQARTRGLLLMALANKFNWLLLATGNKSELSVGYATLYGDMNGALEVIGDVYKTEVYKIAEYINREKEIIPREIITKPPSAELKPGQVDQDTLPPYDKLDAVLHKYLEEYKEYEEIVAELGEPELVAKILRMVDLNEYKRFQSAPVLRVSTKAFGYGRRFPIVQGWRK